MSTATTAASTLLSSRARLEALEATGLLDTFPEESFDRLTRLASQLLDAPVALVTLLEEKRQFFKSAVGLEEPWVSRREMPMEYSFCQYALTSSEPLVIDDARENYLVQNSPAVTENGSLSYVGVPLRSEGQPLGTLCVVDSRPRAWTEEEIRTMADLAAAAQSELDLRLALSNLAQSHTSLAAANARLNEFVGMAAHDLRSPLTVLIGFSKFLLHTGDQAVLPERHQKMLGSIRSSSEFMLRLVDNLLDVSRIEAGELRLEKVPTDLGAMIRQNVELNQLLAEEKGICIAAQIERDLPDVEIDPDKIEQVLNNLFSNALKFSPRETAIEVSLSKRPGELLLRVSDQGPGIPPGEIDKLFRPFGRTSVRATAGEKSTGLGLLIAKQVVGGHGGQIWVESEVGKGTSFFISLPTPEIQG